MNNYQDPQQIQAELLELITKAGRRCAYDLRHAADLCADRAVGEEFRERADMWLKIFNPANGPKDYRNKFHHEIYALERRLHQMAELAKKHGASQEDIDVVQMWGAI